MRIHVWNKTGTDLWMGMVVMNDVAHFVFRPWNELPLDQRNEEDRLKDGQLGSWTVRDSFPIDPNTGVVCAKINVSRRLKVRIETHAKGYQGEGVIFLIATEQAPN